MTYEDSCELEKQLRRLAGQYMFFAQGNVWESLLVNYNRYNCKLQEELDRDAAAKPAAWEQQSLWSRS